MTHLLATTEFIRWSPPHLIALALAVAVAALVLIGGSMLGQKGRFIFCRVLAVIVLLQFVSEYAWRYITGAYGSWENNLPLHFCNFMSLASFIALWWRPRWACALVFFCVLTASIQGLITPAMADGYPSLAFYVFFTSHSLLLVVALAIPVLLGWRGRGYDDLRSILIADAYLLCIIPINIWLGTNYGYTQGSPVEGCLLDYLGPAPWYYLWVQLPALGLFRLMLLLVHDKTEE